MALTFDPFREMDRMAARLLTSGGTQRSSSWMPMDLYRAGDHYIVNVDLPGIDPGSIDLDVDANTLTIQAERTIGAADGAQWLAQERPPAATCGSWASAATSTSTRSRRPTSTAC